MTERSPDWSSSRPSTSPMGRRSSSSRESRAAAAQFGDPWEAAKAWQDQGAEWIHLVDLDAAFGRGSNRDLIDSIVGRLDISVELSGASATPSRSTRRSQPAVAGSTSAPPPWRTPSGPDGSSLSTATGSPSASTCGARRSRRGAGPARAATSGRRSSGSTARAVRATSSPTSTRTACSRARTSICCATCARGPTGPSWPPAGSRRSRTSGDLRTLVGEGVEGAIIGSALYRGAFTLPEALDLAGRPER